MDEQLESQGSDQSPTLLESINAHLSGETTPTTEEQKPANVPTSETPQEQPQEDPQEVQPEAQEPRSRAEERINEVNQKFYEAQRKAEQLELFIASNPQARAAYEAAIYGQQMSQQPQIQTSGNDELPEWDPHDPDVVEKYAEKLFEQKYGSKIQQFEQFLENQKQQAIQTQRQNLIGSVDETLFTELPSAKENDVHFAVANHFLQQEVASFPQEYQYAMANFAALHPQDQGMVVQALQQAAKKASEKAKQELKLGQAAPVAAPPQSNPPKVFSEGATNLVQPRPAGEPTDLNGMIQAHLSRPNS